MFMEVLDWPGFEHTGSAVDYWEWKYLRRPHAGFVSCASWDGPRPVSHASWTATELLLLGREVRGGQVGDLYTHPAHRGQGLADSVLSCMEEGEEIDVRFAFPSEAGYEILSKRGYREAEVPFVQHQLITDPAKFFGQVRLGRLKRVAYEAMLAVRSPAPPPFPGTVEEVRSFPEDAGEMARRCEARFDLTVRHSTAYLDWRYLEPQGGRSRVLVARREGTTAGFAVVRLYGQDHSRYIDILDLMSDPDEPAAAPALLSEVSTLAKREGSDGVQVWLPRGHPAAAALERAGYLPRSPLPNERRLRLLYRTAEGREDLAEALARTDLKAHIMLGDTDWV